MTDGVVQAEPRAPAAVEQPTGTVRLEVFPFAHVVIDGRDYGDASGSRSVTLPAGEHVVVLRHAHRTRRVPVVVKADRTVAVEFNAFKVQ